MLTEKQLDQFLDEFWEDSQSGCTETEQEAAEIMREILELPDIQNAEIVDGKVRVETKDNVFVDVMSTVVNIFSRVAGGCELSFVGFAYRD